MQQMILLEKSDLEAIKHGGTLTIHAGGTAVQIGYAGKRQQNEQLRESGDNSEAKNTRNGHATSKGKIHKKSPCVICRKPYAPQGMRVHLEKHERNGEIDTRKRR